MQKARAGVYIVAEVGSNHGGSLNQAFEYIDACADAGVDAVKFQSWNPMTLQNSLDFDSAGVARPSKVIPILNKYQLPAEWHQPLFDRCNLRGVDFLSTPFDIDRARLLRELGVRYMKVSSSDLTYDELLLELGSYGIPILLSTGMANTGEIAQALELLGHPSTEVTLLQCTAAYPPEIEDANLLAIQTMRNQFGLDTGLSDHYPGWEMAVAAVALGACVIEKHVTHSRSAATPDAPFAIEFDELTQLVRAIRLIERSMGDGVKICRESEVAGLRGGRRGLFAAEDICSGDLITRSMIAVVRPNVGQLQPRDLSIVVGAKSARAVRKGYPITAEDLLID